MVSTCVSSQSLLSVAISGHHVYLHAILGQLQSVAISGTQLQSIAISGHHVYLHAILGQLQSVAISGNQLQSIAISGHHVYLHAILGVASSGGHARRRVGHMRVEEPHRNHLLLVLVLVPLRKGH